VTAFVDLIIFKNQLSQLIKNYMLGSDRPAPMNSVSLDSKASSNALIINSFNEMPRGYVIDYRMLAKNYIKNGIYYILFHRKIRQSL